MCWIFSIHRFFCLYHSCQTVPLFGGLPESPYLKSMHLKNTLFQKVACGRLHFHLLDFLLQSPITPHSFYCPQTILEMPPYEFLLLLPLKNFFFMIGSYGLYSITRLVKSRVFTAFSVLVFFFLLRPWS